MIFSYAWKLVTRNSRRTLTYLFGLALAVGLFSGILFFVDVTARQMTATAIAPVKIDIIAHGTTPDVNISEAAPTIANDRGVSAAEPVYAADFTSATKLNGEHPSPAGRMFAIQPSYLQTFDVLQISEGKLDPSGAVISEAMAIAQNIKLGDSIQLTFNGVTDPVSLPVTGIINLDNADALFATATEAENAIVSDVVIVDQSWFQKNLLDSLTAVASDPNAIVVPGFISLDPQIHVRINRDLLPGDPTLAAIHAESLRRGVERLFPGQLKSTDNLSGAFKSAKGDVLSAKILFIFLGLPGVFLAAYLSKFAAELFAESQRREISLLRTRGATPSQITGIVAVTSLFLAIGGSLLGLFFGILALYATLSRWFFGSAGAQLTSNLNPFASTFDWNLFANSVGIAFLAGLLLTFLAAFLPTFGALRREITQERRNVRRVEAVPFWKRSYFDFILIGIAITSLYITQRNGGFKPSGNEGAAITLSIYIFLTPFFAWTGLTLLVLRLVEKGLTASSNQIGAFFRRLFGEIGEVAGKSLARRASRVSAAVTIIALTLSFGVSLALFQKTYTNEKQLDAQYTVGSDIRFTPALNTPQNADFAKQLQIPGVESVTGVVRDPLALVGSEKNTVYGIDLAAFRKTAYLPDSFFVDGNTQQTIDAMTNRNTNYAAGSAKQVLDALANTPNGVIISVEQAEKYSIHLGDPILLRLYNRSTNQYTDVQTQAVGLFIYFPTSAQDSDFILNSDFMIKSSGYAAMNYFLIKTDGKPQTIANITSDLTAQYKNVMPVRIQNIDTVIKTESSSLTSLNLGGLGAMERLYTIVVVSMGLAIFLLAMINERQREFGAMRALGANLSHLRRFLFTEALAIGGMGLIIGAGVGVLLARLLVLLLGVIFTIPAQSLSWPVLELSTLAAFVVAGMIISVAVTARRLSTLKVVEALREL
ncbi:MAG: FtsX-like permease family protein [Chloroflexota bacterium]